MNDGEVERAATFDLQCHEDTPAVSAISHIRMDGAAPAGQIGLLPPDDYVPQYNA